MERKFMKKASYLLVLCFIMLGTIIADPLEIQAAKKMSLDVKTTSYIRTNESTKKVKKQTITIKNLSSNCQVTWKSSNTKVAAVKAQKKAGKATLTTKLGKEGTATIKATIKNKKTKKVVKTLNKKIVVKQGATGINITDKKGKQLKSTTLPLNQTLFLYADVLPKGKVSVASQEKVTWSLATDSKSKAGLDTKKKTLTPKQSAIAGRGKQKITVYAAGYKNTSAFKQTLNVTVDGGKLKPDAKVDDTMLRFAVQLTVPGDLTFLLDAKCTMTGISGNAVGKTINARCYGKTEDKAYFLLENTDKKLTDLSGNYNGDYRLSCNIPGIQFTSDIINFTDTKYVEMSRAFGVLSLEVTKLKDAAYTNTAVVNDTLKIPGFDDINPIVIKNTFIVNNDYISLEDGTFVLKKLNDTDQEQNITFVVELIYPGKIATIRKPLQILLPVTIQKTDPAIISATNAEAEKINDASFTSDAVVTDKLPLPGLSDILAGYTVTASIDENEYVRLDNNEFILKKLNHTNNAIQFNYEITVTHPNARTKASAAKTLIIPISKTIIDAQKATDTEAEKFKDAFFTRKSEINDTIALLGLSDLTDGFTVAISLEDNDYVSMINNEFVLKQLNTGDSKKEFNIKIIITHPNQKSTADLTKKLILPVYENNGVAITDVEILREIVYDLEARGAAVSSDLTDATEYIWEPNTGNLLGLSWGNKNIQGELDLSKLKNLVMIDCKDNNISQLDVSNIPNLNTLLCGFNALTSLDVTTVPNLMNLYCSTNELTSLDVSAQTNLTNLDCSSNQLTSLDISNSKYIFTLNCSVNKLTSINITNLNHLMHFNCSENLITELDFTGTTFISKLECAHNKLTSIDISDLSILSELYCNGNELQSLDASNLTRLQFIDCYDNQLTSLNVQNAAALKYLYCWNNSLTALDVSTNPFIECIDCTNNQLSDLSVSNLTVLRELFCKNNNITRLDVTGLTRLTSLDTDNNVEIIGR